MIDPTLPTRRELLRVGALGLGGLGLARAFELLERSGAPPTARPRSAILLWLDGGASHIDTFDAKPAAPVEIRGSWGSVPTPMPGVRFGQGLQGLASALPRYALIRSVTSEAGEHEIARHLLLTGYPITPALEYPSYGSVAAHLSKSEDFPPYLTIGKGSRQLHAGF
ncbi:MAG TPA: DUF1501 domain-containing protein, partial [Planctomycetota bacterium]|nr:DUF1501 domain-containing protein [Planctomycetota bacterium]